MKSTRQRKTIDERRKERENERKMSKKDMPKLIQRCIDRHNHSIEELKKELIMFKKKGLNVGDYAFHKDYGKCLIMDIVSKLDIDTRDRNIKAEIATLHGEQIVLYDSLIKPGPGLEVLFEEN